MNESGRSVQDAARFYKIAPDHVCVIHDELDLEPGRLRVKKGGGAGGHNGLKSIDSCLPNKDYWRVRLGIGHPGHKDRVHGYVLSDFPKVERKNWVDKMIAIQSDHMGLIIKGEHEKFMSNVAQDMRGAQRSKRVELCSIESYICLMRSGLAFEAKTIQNSELEITNNI